MAALHLSNRALLTVTGSQAESFLQGLVTASVPPLGGIKACHGALLTPQGKLRHEFILVAKADHYLIDIVAQEVAAILKLFNLYKLRAEVEITKEQTGLQVLASLTGDEDESMGGTISDPRCSDLGVRHYCSVDVLGHNLVEDHQNDYQARRVELGIAESDGEGGLQSFFPHDIGMDLWGGVAFDKGCFIGQEVVSRMEHRGTARKRPVVLTGKELEKRTDNDVMADGKIIGILFDAAGDNGLAILRIDRLVQRH